MENATADTVASAAAEAATADTTARATADTVASAAAEAATADTTARAVADTVASVAAEAVSSGPIDITFAKVVFVLFVIGAAWSTAYIVNFLLDRLAQRLPSYRLLFKRLVPVLRLLIYAITIYLVITIVSPEEASLYAILGSMALALGLAAKDLLNDIIGGIVVLFDRSFQVGDRIAVGGHYGEVVSIGLRSTKLVTPDDSLVTVPNSAVLSSTVSNTNAGAVDCQVVVNIFLPANTDLEQVESLAREAVLTSKMAYLNKPVVVNVKDEFKETYLSQLIVKAYVFDTRYENVFAADLTRRIKKELLHRGLVPGDLRFGEGPRPALN